MEKTYWIGRKRSALAAAVGAASSEARLIHYDMAGRYSVKAALCAPFMAAPAAAAGERAALHAPPPPEARREPDPA